MNDRAAQPERRKRNLRDTALWERDLNGYAVCPWCAAMIYSDRAALHQEKCTAAQPERRRPGERGEGRADAAGESGGVSDG